MSYLELKEKKKYLSIFDIFLEVVTLPAKYCPHLEFHEAELLLQFNQFFSFGTSVRPKSGFGIGNRNQDQVSVSVLVP